MRCHERRGKWFSRGAETPARHRGVFRFSSKKGHFHREAILHTRVCRGNLWTLFTIVPIREFLQRFAVGFAVAVAVAKPEFLKCYSKRGL